MSTNQNEISLLTTFIKLENDSDEDSTCEKSLELQNNDKDYYSTLSLTSTMVTPNLSSAYKGKIEVTSKGRRKIFDGVRWQILCRRPECRKQTNKKSLCITHYKEEYEFNNDSLWSNNLPSFQVPSYQPRCSFDNTKSRTEIEDQNNTISTTNITDNDDQLPLNMTNNRIIHEGQIKLMHNGRRFILKNSKWQPLCKYDNICRNMAKFELLCIKHFEVTQKKRRNLIKHHNNDTRRPQSSLFQKPRSIFSNNIIKRLKTNNDYQISSSSVTEQFDINSNENSHKSTKPTNGDFSSLTSKLPGFEVPTSSKKTLNVPSSDYSSLKTDESKFKKVQQTDQSVQTDLTISLCCIIHHDGHSFHSSCINDKSTSSISSYDTKHEPQYYTTKFST